MKSVPVLLLLATAVLSGQNPTQILPGAYTVQFENEWVKVTRVRYQPLAKLPAHEHTPRASAYVYLNDGGPVIFRHIGGNGTAATRPATKAGSVRVYRGLDEIHEVENTANIPSEFLRVELKTEPTDPATFRGKFGREPGGSHSSEQIQFDHSQLSISRLVITAGQSLPVSTQRDLPTLYIALSAGAVKFERTQGSVDVSVKVGDHFWAEPRSVTKIENRSQGSVELLRFELKTKPLLTSR